MIDWNPSDLLIGISILGILVFIFILIGTLRAVSRRNSFLNEMKEIQKSVRDLQSKIHSLQVNYRQNQNLNHEPYLSSIKTFQVELSWIESEFDSFKNSYVHLQEKINLWQKRKKISYWISFLPGEDFDQLSLAASSLSGKIIILNKYLMDAFGRTKGIAELSWKVAGEIREIYKKLENSRQTLQELLQQHVHGESIEDAINVTERANDKILNIPPILFEGSKEDILNQTDYEMICQSYECYQEILPIIENVGQLVNQWWNDFQLTKQKINTTQTALENAQTIISDSSDKIELGHLQENLKTIQSISDILTDTLNRVEIECLPEMIQEADRIYQLINETTDTVKNARRNLSILEPLLEQIELGLSQIDEQISVLNNHPVIPVAWDESGDRLFSLNRRSKEIIVQDRLRSPSEIQDHLSLALDIYKDIVDLSSHVKQTVMNHETLLSLYSTEEINQGLYWFQEANRILSQAKKYNQANFPKNLSIEQLSQSLGEMQKRHQAILKDMTASPIRQSMIQAFVDEMRSLHESYIVMYEQVAEVKSYLTIFREEENQIREILQKNAAILNQLSSIIKSSSLLMKQGEKELNRLKKNLDVSYSKIDDMSRGTIENKRTIVMSLNQRIENVCKSWIAYFEKNIQSLSDTLRETLDKVDGLVNLDDVIVFQARKLVAQAEQESKNSANNISEEIYISNLVLDLKEKIDLWNELSAVSKELTETIEKPIVDAYEAALMQKEMAMKQLLLAADQIPEKRSWPATSFVLSSLKSDLEAINGIWEKIPSQSMRAILWVREFGEISNRYQEFIFFIMNAVETCRYERQVIAGLEERLDEIDRKWTILEQSVGDNRLAAASIHAIKREYEKQYNQIKKRWQLSGSVPGMSPSFEEIKNSLVELINHFETAVATIKNEQGEITNFSIQEVE
ncbi:MAG: hypothetical protein ABFD53_02065 [Anaerolineaceae bacterium]